MRADERIRLELVEEGLVLAVTTADIERPGLSNAGIGDGRHAFRIALPPTTLSRVQRRLELRCTDTGASVPGSPLTLDSIPEQPPPALRWHIDEITDDGVVGWAFAPGEPTRRCIVALREGRRLHARAAASRYRPGLREAGLGDGACAFLLPLPYWLLDGEEHRLDIIEQHTGTALNEGPLVWRSTADTAGAAVKALVQHAGQFTMSEPEAAAPLHSIQLRTSAAAGHDSASAAAPDLATRILFDISDLVYCIGEHANLTGIQRVQSSIVLSLLNGALPPDAAAIFLSYNTASRRWEAVPTAFVATLLRDLFLPESERVVAFAPEDAARGHLPGALPFDAPGVLDDGTPSVMCLLGAGWNKPDYFHRVLAYKRRHGTRFVMLVHDLVPIYARDTCDQPTGQMFEGFLRHAARHTDHFLAVSEHTARDLRRYIASLGLPEPAITVTRNGSSFAEFLPNIKNRAAPDDLPARFVLFVATIEGRKNHGFILDLWRRLESAGDNPPHLVCVGRIGWRAERFVSDLTKSRHLDGKIIVLQGVSDTHLGRLYEQCLFTVYPSLYEGWGLPIGEALTAGKICLCSDRASLPEVAGKAGTCIPLEDTGRWLDTLRTLMTDDAARRRQEALIRAIYRTITWPFVAASIAAACKTAATIAWAEPYPAPAVPYGTEISFARLAPAPAEWFADGIPSGGVDSGRGHFLPDPLPESRFLLGQDARAGGTWAEPGPWGTWVCSPSSKLLLGLPLGGGLIYVFLRVRTSAAAAGLPATILANNETVWQDSFTERPQDLMLRLRRRDSAGMGTLRLQVDLHCPPGLGQHAFGSDGRAPTIGFERLIAVPEEDFSLRLDVLTTLQLRG